MHTFGFQPCIGADAGYGWLDLGDARGNGFETLAAPGGNSATGPTLVSFGSAGAFA